LIKKKKGKRKKEIAMLKKQPLQLPIPYRGRTGAQVDRILTQQRKIFKNQIIRISQTTSPNAPVHLQETTW